MKKWVWWSISWFGVSGRFKHIRGTWGTLAALPFAYAIQISAGNIALAAAGCAVFVLGVIASNHYVAETGKQDPGEIVIDEVAAIFILLAYMTPTWQSYLAAFIIFRIFDILKPWPVSWADKHVKGGLGVMFDDVLAALYPVALVAIAHFIKPEWTGALFQWLQIPL